MHELEQCRNLGPRSAAMLEKVGIRTFQDLQRMGAAAAYVDVKRSGERTSLNLLWALEGALTERAWQEVARQERLHLLLQVDALENRSGPADTTQV